MEKDRFLDLRVTSKSDNSERDVLTIERDNHLRFAIIDDSILVASHIRSTSGNLSFMTNLRDSEVEELFCGIGATPFYEDAVKLNTIENGEWRASLYQRQLREDMFLIVVRTPYDVEWQSSGEKIAIIGAKVVKLVHVESERLIISVRWQNVTKPQPPQLFLIKVPEQEALTPKKFFNLPWG